LTTIAQESEKLKELGKQANELLKNAIDAVVTQDGDTLAKHSEDGELKLTESEESLQKLRDAHAVIELLRSKFADDADKTASIEKSDVEYKEGEDAARNVISSSQTIKVMSVAFAEKTQETIAELTTEAEKVKTNITDVASVDAQAALDSANAISTSEDKTEAIQAANEAVAKAKSSCEKAQNDLADLNTKIADSKTSSQELDKMIDDATAALNDSLNKIAEAEEIIKKGIPSETCELKPIEYKNIEGLEKIGLKKKN
jgi:chromosome segregation ATPase